MNSDVIMLRHDQVDSGDCVLCVQVSMGKNGGTVSGYYPHQALNTRSVHGIYSGE